MKQSILVSVNALPGISTWEAVRGAVEGLVPLNNLHWKTPTRPLKSIQNLHLTFRPFSETTAAQASTTLVDKPYLHLLFVVCEDNELYRTTLRGQIKDWLDRVLASPNQEWLVVHLTVGRTAGNKFYQRKSAVVDKIKADFNTGKRDRCIQVAQTVPAEDAANWAEFITKAKEGIIATFDSNVILYEEDVRKADSQRQLHGWSFCSFFIQKEALAECFESVNLHEEALIQFDELEASFFQTLKENNLAGFTEFGGLAVGDDSLSIVSISSKPYRESIASSTISIFDFRIYLFARQAALLLKVGKITDLAKRGAYFISTFARTLREHQDTLGQHFLESWTYSSCLHLVGACETYFATNAVPVSVAFTAVKAELLELARKQLDKVGIVAGHLPLAHPFSMSLNEIITERSPHILPALPDAVERIRVSRQDLADAIASRDVFDKLYIDLTTRAGAAYQASRRSRCALKLDASLAALEEYRERYPSAQKTYARLPSQYVELRWARIESLLLDRSKALQDRLSLSKESLLSTLALVRAGIEFGSKSWSLDSLRADKESRASTREESRILASKLMADVRTSSAGLVKDFAAIAFPTFEIRLASDRGGIDALEDGVNVSVIVKSLLPCPIDVEEVRLKFLTAHDEQVWFTSKPWTLEAGETTVTLFSPTAVMGCLSLQLSQIRYSRIIFQYSHRPISERNLAPDLRFVPTTGEQQCKVYFPRDHQALDIYLELPKSIRLDQDRQGILCISTGRNEIVSLSLKLATDLPGAKFDFSQATLLDATMTGSIKIDPLNQSLILENLGALMVVRVQFPLTGVLLDAAMDVDIAAEYFTVKRPFIRRTLRRQVYYPVALPLAVTVQDFFRKDCLLSKFSVNTDGFNALRIRSATLEGNSEVAVESCRGVDGANVTILPLQTANFLFKIVRQSTATPELPLELTLQYRPIYDEFHSVVKRTMLGPIQAADLEAHLPWFTSHVIPAVEEATNLHWYGVSGSLAHLQFTSEKWTQSIEENWSSKEERPVVVETLQRIYERLVEVSSADVEDDWRKLTIPVELPCLNILNLVSITPSSSRVEVGAPISVVLSISPTFSWSRSVTQEPVVLLYDVNCSGNDWLLSGRKRGEFLAQDNQEHMILLTLIPLRAGSLFLPSITIRPLISLSGGMGEDPYPISCETQNSTAARIVEVLPLASKTTFSIDTQGAGRVVFAL